MESPFPGMDPYLEGHWHDVQHGLITYMRDYVQDYLSDDLWARIGKRTVDGADTCLPSVNDMLGLGLFIEIVYRDRPQTMITAIEILTASHKVSGPGREWYRSQRKRLAAADANLLEIDLIRCGQSVLEPDEKPTKPIPDLDRANTVYVRRSGSNTTRIYLINLKEMLPVIAMPLRKGEPEIQLDLQAFINLCYKTGRFDRLDYSNKAVPPLDAPDDKWASQLLSEKWQRP
jgi:hypothetical protein